MKLSNKYVGPLFSYTPEFSGLSVVLLVLCPIFLVSMALDERTLLDINIWVKPLKFSLSLIFYLVTLSYFARWLSADLLKSQAFQWYKALICLVVVYEMIWITGAAYIGTQSHFNISSSFMITAYGIAGVFALILTSATLVFALSIYRNPINQLDHSLKLAIVSGLVITGVATVVVAGYMSSSGAHNIGGPNSDANSYWLVGWLKDQGDLRVAHFFATHAMHFIPLFGWLTLGLKSRKLAYYSVVIFSLLYTGYIGFTFLQALKGEPWL